MATFDFSSPTSLSPEHHPESAGAQPDYDVIVLGAGASGMMCAVTAARRGRRVLLVDHNDRPGMKIRISGGGKCNLTNRRVSFEDYVGENTNFCRSSLARFTPETALNALSAAGIAVEEREEGQIFCKRSSKDLLNYLMNDCRDAGCAFALREKILSARKVPGESDALFSVITTAAARTCSSLVIACGSPARSSAGGTHIGYTLATSFGHSCLPVRPVLVGLLLPYSPFTELSGIAVRASIDVLGDKGRERIRAASNLPLLFTHRGISGPAALQASLYRCKGDALSVDFLPEVPLQDILRTPGSGKLVTVTLLKKHLPDRLAALLLPVDLADKRVGDLSKAQRNALLEAVHAYLLFPSGTEGFAKAEAAAGGVSTNVISSRSMESALVPNLYFCGEVLDVTGRLGGYNLHWAFASGRAAGEFV